MLRERSRLRRSTRPLRREVIEREICRRVAVLWLIGDLLEKGSEVTRGSNGRLWTTR